MLRLDLDVVEVCALGEHAVEQVPLSLSHLGVGPVLVAGVDDVVQHALVAVEDAGDRVVQDAVRVEVQLVLLRVHLAALERVPPGLYLVR